MKYRNMGLKIVSTAAGLAGMLAVASQSAHAVTFNFNSLSDGASNSQVQTYMNGVLGSTGTVNVIGALGENNYTGDNHVVGPVTSETLGTSDSNVHHSGNNDTFLVNSTSNNDRIKMVFSVPIYSISFDYEIFPNGSCPDAGATGCANDSSTNWPDFTFKADGTQIFRTLGTDPCAGGTYTHSPFSGASNCEKAPQLLGLSGLISFQNGVTTLEFIDWPQQIGIDNLNLDFCGANCSPSRVPNNVPEPSATMLVGIGMISMITLRALATRRS